MNRFQRRPLALAVITLGLATMLPAASTLAQESIPQGSQAAVSQQQYSLDIPAQDLASALNALSLATRVQIMAPGDILQGRQSKALQGQYSLPQALELLLSDQPLSFQQSGNASFTIRSADSAQANRPIEEVLVVGSYVLNRQLDTATGLGLTLQETPQSVSVMTFQRIEDQGLRSLTDVINNAAGISSKAFDSSRNGFSARGFDVDNYQIDGIPVQWDAGASAGETQTDLALYERVEIVRGATGLLTGAGNPSASINLVRKHATSDEFVGQVTATASRWNNYQVSADLSSPLNESGSVRGRTVVSYGDGDSYVDYYGNKKQVLYGVIDADLTDSTYLSVGASYQDNEPRASQWGGLPIFFSDGSRTDWARSKTVGADWTHWSTTHKTYFANIRHEFSNGWVLSANANRNVSSADMRLVFLFGVPDRITGLGMGASPRRYDNEREQTDFGLRLSGDYTLFDRDHELVVGYSYSEQDFVYNGYERDSVAPVGNFLEWDGSYAQPNWGAKTVAEDYSTEQKGYFAATRLNLTDALKVVLGSRIATWERKGTSYGASLDYGDDNVAIPYAGALYDLNDQHTVYASYTEIFQPQNRQDKDNNFLDPLTGKNYEIGLKSSFFEDALHTTVTYFEVEQDNLAVNDPDFVPTPDRLSAFKAAQGVESDGFELEVNGEITDNWKVSGSYTSFEATETDSAGQSNVVNTRFPRKILRLFSTYNFEKFTVGGGVAWEGENYTDLNTPLGVVRVGQESYALVNLMARYDFSEQLSVQANIDNLTDKKYYSQIGFYSQLAYGEPRNISLSVKYQF